MEYFKFISDRGSIDFSLASVYVLSEIEASNLNGAETQKQEHRFVGLDGAEYTNILYDPDDLPLKGFIKAVNRQELSVHRAYLHKILNGKEKGKLYYIVGNKTYFTEALPLRPQMAPPVQNIQSFTVYFKRLAPLWKEGRLSKYSIYKLTKNLKSTFEFPLVFSQRISRCDVLNSGDIETGCVIKIKGGKKSDGGTANEISVINHTTGESMILSYTLENNEQIEIDTNNYTVISSLNGNVMNRIKSESKFIKLAVGVNDIEIVNSNAGNEIYASIEFYNTVLGV